MKPQPFCSLPFCGASFSEPTHSRRFVVDGKLVRFTYPAMIDMHDVTPRSMGGDKYDLANQVALCHDCHMAHHDGREWLEFSPMSNPTHVRREGEPWQELVTADEWDH